MSDTPETDKAEDRDPIMYDDWAWIVPANFARRLERERDEARREIKELKRAAIEVLKAVPVAYCSEMHHGKRDIHSALEPCPVAERFNARIDKLRALLKEEA